MMKQSVFFILLLKCFFAFSQSPTYYNIGEKEFANTDVFTLLYDDETDILYAGTSNGLFAYVQNTFVKIKDAPGQIGASFFALKQDKEESIYCHNLNGQLFKLNGFNLEVFAEIPSEYIGNQFNYHFTNDGKIITHGAKGLFIIDKEGKIEQLLNSKSNELEQSSFYHSQQLQDGKIIVSSASGDYYGSYIYDKDSFVVFTEAQHIWDNFNKGWNKYCFYFQLNNAWLYTNSNNKLITQNESIKIDLPPLSYQRVQPFNKNEFIALNLTHGAQILSLRKDTLSVSQTFFESDFLSAFTKNKSGTLFFGTFGEGIKVVPNRNVTAKKSEELLLGIDVSPDNDVFISTRSGKVFQNTELTVLKKRNKNIDDVYYIGPNYFSSNIIFNGFNNEIDAIKDLCIINDSLLLIADRGGLILYASNAEEFSSTDFYYHLKKNKQTISILPTTQRCNTVAYSQNDNLIYYSTNFGLFSTSLKERESSTIYYNKKEFLCSDLEVYGNTLVCATQNNGILFYKDGLFTKQLQEIDGVSSNTIKNIKIVNDLLYLLSNKGLQVYDLIKQQFINLGFAEGLINNDVTNFAVSNDKLWVLEKHQYYAIEIASIYLDKEIAKLYLDSIVVNDKAINYEVLNSFNYKENAVSFYFDYRDIESKQETKIAYRLDGFYDGWRYISSSKNKIEFQSLPIGKYTFKIKAIYRGQKSNVFEYRFEIFPPIWQRWWFYVLLVIGVAFIAFLIAKYQSIKAKKRNTELLEKEMLSKDLAQTKLKALRSQMNPHFIFNSLNSIQDLVLQQDVDKSYDYIVMFAELVRNTLNYSEQEFISIDKELEFLKVYLELEKLRFGDEFTYNIAYSGSNDLKIPSLVVQPFIENALLHGLLHKKGQKELSITFSLEEQMICTIVDNGIGREKAAEIKQRQKNQHTSFSTQAIKKRMEILSTQFGMEASFKYEDILAEDGICGTKVIITIPFQLF